MNLKFLKIRDNTFSNLYFTRKLSSKLQNLSIIIIEYIEFTFKDNQQTIPLTPIHLFNFINLKKKYILFNNNKDEFSVVLRI
ncbi:hypothetical protein BpHYR1_053306 [Brachionus plicatilis]|uniref:Uncharacterized protein n=1 Tax=Brachionus plicatilis TaxID=10195 RepID=A0A3M7T3S3_BRAPC|nr:hypothetical protein BpHYR1_053306 [Brachionus plicatilis]